MKTEVTTTLYLEDFMCDCDEDEKAASDAVLKDVLQRLGCRRRDLVTQAIMSLNWDYGTIITGIPCDQWSCVLAKSDVKDGHQIVACVQCDRVEHGIARLWQAVADLYLIKDIKEQA